MNKDRCKTTCPPETMDCYIQCHQLHFMTDTIISSIQARSRHNTCLLCKSKHCAGEYSVEYMHKYAYVI